MIKSAALSKSIITLSFSLYNHIICVKQTFFQVREKEFNNDKKQLFSLK